MERTLPLAENTPSKGEEKRLAWKKRGIEFTVYLLVFLVTLILFLTLKPLYATQYPGAVAQSLIAIAFAAAIAVGAALAMSKKLTYGKALCLLFVLACVLRIGYMLYTPVSVRQHDTYNSSCTGHEAYAWTIFSTGKLPSSNAYQFYHPPLNAAIQAAFMKCMQVLSDFLTSIFSLGDYFPSRFLQGMNNHAVNQDVVTPTRYYLYSTTQILAVVYSVATCVTLLKTLKLFRFSQKTELFLAVFLLFFPRHIQFAAQVNNDALSYLLACLALYHALKWQKEGKSFVRILLCALCVGLGMSAKLSSATVCLPIAGIFLYELIGTATKRANALGWGRICAQYGTFICLCAPVGLWFQVYAMHRFGQEFGFVFSNLNQLLSTKRHSAFERFFVAFDWREYFGSLYCVPFSSWADKANGVYATNGHYNLFNYLVRSSIFGEFSFWRGEGFAVVALLAAWASAFALFASFVRCVVLYVRNRKGGDSLWIKADVQGKDLLFLGLLLLSQIGSEIYFYIAMPYSCTMDFRYIMPMILALALSLGYTDKILATDKGKTSLALRRATFLSVGLFLAFSTAFYCVCI